MSETRELIEVLRVISESLKPIAEYRAVQLKQWRERLKEIGATEAEVNGEAAK